jgi:hypothetical protein
MRPALRLRAVRVAAIGISLLTVGTASAATVFTETFNRTNNSTIGNNWVESNPGGGDVAIASQELNILSNSNFDSGLSYITMATSNFASPFASILTNNPGLVTWTFNMRSGQSDLSGFSTDNEGIAVVLAATSSDMSTANGYAVVWGQSGTTDPIRLVRFAGGLDSNTNLTSMITASGASGTGGDPNTSYMSVKVTYNPNSDTFELFTRSDGTSAFSDPAAGTYTSAGTLVNTTYTSSTITSFALVGAYGANNQDLYFDSIGIDVVPEPGTMCLAGVGAACVMSRRRRRA